MSGGRPITGPQNLISRPRTNSIVGPVLLFLTNYFLPNDIPINLLTLIICAIGERWILILILHLLGVAY